MRPLVTATVLAIATGMFAPSPTAAQNPEQSSPPQEVAVPRRSPPPPAAPAPAPAPPPSTQERRGSARAPERAVERPERAEQPTRERAVERPVRSEPPAERPAEKKAVVSDNPAPTPAAAATDSNPRAEEQRGERRGAVRRPPSDGVSTGDRAVVRRDGPPPTRTSRYPHRYYPRYYRYYDPWGYGSFGLGYFYYSPWAWGPYGAYGYPGYSAGYSYDVGRVRLKVQPRDAEVWVDGYYAGTVDDFDGVFQSLRLDSGGYRIEVRKPGFETLTFDVRVQPDRTVTFRGKMRPLP
jgi:PEGA domain